MTTVGSAPRPVTFVGSAPYFGALLAVALIAFWPTYLSRVGAASGYTHLHALTATAWMLLLIAQPAAIRSRKLALHRALGRLSYFVAPLVVVSMVLLAHKNSSASGISEVERLGVYVPLSLVVLFGLSYALAIVTRKIMALHSRFMVCTALTLIDPVGVRLMFWAFPKFWWKYQWPTFVLTDFIFLALIWRERHMRSGRAVFPVMLVLFAVAQGVLLFDWYRSPLWGRFVQWFLAFDLT
jgi:hypothetical protein